MTIAEWRESADDAVFRFQEAMEQARKELSMLCLDWPTRAAVMRDPHVAELADQRGAEIVAYVSEVGRDLACAQYEVMRQLHENTLALRRAVQRVASQWSDMDVEHVRKRPRLYGLDTEILDNIDKGEL